MMVSHLYVMLKKEHRRYLLQTTHLLCTFCTEHRLYMYLTTFYPTKTATRYLLVRYGELFLFVVDILIVVSHKGTCSLCSLSDLILHKRLITKLKECTGYVNRVKLSQHTRVKYIWNWNFGFSSLFLIYRG